MAIACFGLVTFFPLRPDFSLPCFISRISRSTALPAAGLYLRVLDDFFDELFLAGVLFADDLADEDSFVDFFEDEDFFAEDFLVALFFFVAMCVPPRRMGRTWK